MGNYIIVESKVADPEGLHARPSDAISNIASVNFGEVILDYKGNKIDSKNIMNLMMQAIMYNSRVRFFVEVGPLALPCSRALFHAISDRNLTDNFDKYIRESELIRGAVHTPIFL